MSVRIDPATFGAALEALAPGGKLLLAVSGGGDSMAMLHLAQRWRPRAICAVATVNHGLRAEATSEAQFVADHCALMGLKHHLLEWRGEKPVSGLAEAARAARYDLLCPLARDYGAMLVLAHTQDDQAETFLMRLARGSGVDGLSAMAGATWRDGALLLRPLLGVSRAALRAYLREIKAQWIEDPTNDDLRHDRIKARALLADPAWRELGFEARRLSQTAEAMARARASLEGAALARLASMRWTRWGVGRIDRAALLENDEETALRALSLIIRAAGGAAFPASLAPLERMRDWLRGAKPLEARTVKGALIRLAADGRTLIALREPARISHRLGPGAREWLWDGRFEAPAIPPGLELRALGALGVAQAKERGFGAIWENERYEARLGAPSFWRGDQLVAIPGLDAPPLRFLTPQDRLKG